ALPGRALPLLGAAAALATAGIGGFHAGVEWGWWTGPQACSGGAPVGAMSVEDLTEQIMAAPLARCDEVPWALGGISMAGWNALLSLGLAALWLAAAQRAPAPRQG
ncbi:MAG: disulfide bond formation protein B, partial [Paracoccaceae bacterium]